jgi:beta-galactosidase
MYSSLAAGSNGFLLWCFTDAAPETYLRAPYLRAPHETQFGLTTCDRQDRPQGVELRNFSQVLSHMDFADLEPESASAGIVVPREWSKPHGDFSDLGITVNSVIPYVSTQDGGAVSGSEKREPWELNLWLVGVWLSTLILGRQAGLKMGFPRENGDWASSPLLFLPAPLTSTSDNLVHVHTNFWESAKHYVKSGGSLYASLCADVAIPDMDELFGARLADHTPVYDVTLKLVAPFGDLQPGETFHFVVDGGNPKNWAATVDIKGGQVIAIDQDGRPALVANQYGKGKTLLCIYPIESYLAQTPAAFEGQQNVYKLYQAFRQWAGVKALFTTDQPLVEVSALVGEKRGYAIFANHGPHALQVNVTSRLSLKTIRQVEPSGFVEKVINDKGFEISMDGFNGAIVEWFL